MSWRKYRFKAIVWALGARAQWTRAVLRVRAFIYDYGLVGVYERAAAAQRAWPRDRDRELSGQQTDHGEQKRVHHQCIHLMNTISPANQQTMNATSNMLYARWTRFLWPRTISC